MEKLELLPAEYNELHLNRHSNVDSLTIGSKVVRPTTKEDIATILAKTDKAYQEEIEKYGNPGRKVFAVKTDRWVGTDAMVPVEELQNDKIFNVVREPGVEGRSVNIKVALIEPKDMPKTNVVHAIYGPAREQGKAGIYTVIFGDPGEPFPADWQSAEQKAKAEEFWNGKNGKGGHAFLVTPQELEEAIKQMDENGLDTTIAKKRLAEFQKNPTSPIISHKPSEMAKDAIDLGKVYLKPVIQMSNFKGKEI